MHRLSNQPHHLAHQAHKHHHRVFNHSPTIHSHHFNSSITITSQHLMFIMHHIITHQAAVAAIALDTALDTTPAILRAVDVPTNSLRNFVKVATHSALVNRSLQFSEVLV